MGITKREIASELGVSKRTVANYIEKLGLGNHVSRNGNTDFLDDFAVAAIADALKNPGKPPRRPADEPTAYQWCDLGFVPIAEARWRLTRYGGNSAWYYCSPWDVRYDPDRAKELLETGPREYDRLPDGRPYDGRPWWQA